MPRTLSRSLMLALALTVTGTPVSVFAQTTPNPLAQPATPPEPATRRLTVEDAVKLALEHNLGVQVARVNPQLQDLSIASARANWAPSLTSTLVNSSIDSPTNSFLSGGQGPKISDDRFESNVGVSQVLPWGAN